jgi:hypothetical protein
MSLANRLAQLDQELDAFQKPPEALEGMRTRLLADRSTDLVVVDGELDALAADVAGLDAVLDAARQQAASRGAELAAEARKRDEHARAIRAEADARVAALTAEQDAAREARAAREAQAAADREANAAQRAQQAAADQAQREAAAAQRAEREAAERAARAEQAARERDAMAARPASRPAPAMDESAATTLSQLLADELEDEADQPTPTASTQAVESASDDTDLFGTDLFGDLGADAFDAPQDRLDDVVSSDDRGAQPSAFVDLASLLEQEDARSAPSPSAASSASESDDLMAALFADSPEEPASPVVEARPKTVPPPIPTPASVRPPALAAAVLDGARESFEDLSDEIDMMEVDDFEIVIDESGDDGAGTGTELDGPGLSAEEMAPDAMHTTPDHEPEDPEKKGGFFKKLFR